MTIYSTFRRTVSQTNADDDVVFDPTAREEDTCTVRVELSTRHKLRKRDD
jgi:hypothetical protein